MNSQDYRQAHATLNLPSRRLKGQKIERLLQLDHRPRMQRMLEVGTGSGGIAHYFAAHPELNYSVDAVDVKDNRVMTEGYRYTPVQGTHLPFEEQTFDVVLSNHVIEHVGDIEAQMDHLRELRRVLKIGGVGYFAVPNRWMLVEPHYKLAFLSWLPHGWRTPYLRLCGKGGCYDCEPLQKAQVESMFKEVGLNAQNIGVQAIRTTLELEKAGTLAHRLSQRIPSWLIGLFSGVIPTLVYCFTREEHG
jgi:ubiquinone/menaquinone biosynthesis C-methylase UbiE